MASDAAITVRIPASLKRQIESAARKDRRSLSSQVVRYLEAAVVAPASAPIGGATRVRLMGRFVDATVPAERDFQEVRRLLWGRLPRRRERSRS